MYRDYTTCDTTPSSTDLILQDPPANGLDNSHIRYILPKSSETSNPDTNLPKPQRPQNLQESTITSDTSHIRHKSLELQSITHQIPKYLRNNTPWNTDPQKAHSCKPPKAYISHTRDIDPKQVWDLTPWDAGTWKNAKIRSWDRKLKSAQRSSSHGPFSQTHHRKLNTQKHSPIKSLETTHDRNRGATNSGATSHSMIRSPSTLKCHISRDTDTQLLGRQPDSWMTSHSGHRY